MVSEPAQVLELTTTETEDVATPAPAPGPLSELSLDYRSDVIGRSRIVHADAFEWLSRIPENSLHAIVTDPPYGVKEFESEQLAKRAAGVGGIWRIPPSFDGANRQPLPRFTALNEKERKALKLFFTEWAKLVVKALRPGGHVLMASNAFISQLTWSALTDGGLEFRGEVIRIVRTMRGGDRPKNAEEEFAGVCSMPRGCFEPWGIFRKPMPSGMKVSDCLREFGTGGLRRTPNDLPFCDLIHSERTPKYEKQLANHPSLKPQSFMRQMVHAALPLGAGVIADTFMGSGSTVAAAEAIGVQCIGVEKYADYYDLAHKAIPKLSALNMNPWGRMQMELDDLE